MRKVCVLWSGLREPYRSPLMMSKWLPQDFNLLEETGVKRRKRVVVKGCNFKKILSFQSPRAAPQIQIKTNRAF